MISESSIAPSWREAALGEVAEIHDDKREPINASQRASRSGPYPYYGATGQVGWIDDYKLDGEFILLGEDGAPFLDATKPKAYISSGRFWVNNHAHVLRGKNEIVSNRFLLHVLNATDYSDYVNGTTRLKLTQGAMRRIPVVVPPLAEQDRIVDEIETQLSRLDAGVAALKRVQANLKRYRAAVLQAACEGRLVPTEAELARTEGRGYEPASRLLERILVERRARWDADAISSHRLPDGWCWCTLGQISDIQGGIQKQPKRAPKDNAFPFLRVANVHRGYLELSDIHKIELFSNEIIRLRLQRDDLLIVEGNGSPSEIGRMALWDGSIPDCVHQNHIIRGRVFPPVSPRFVEAYWNSPIGSQLVANRASSTSGLHTLSVHKVSGIPIPLPPSTEQERIVTEVEHCLSVIEAMELTVAANLKRAERLRQSILKRAFEGKLVPQDPEDEPASVLLERIRAVSRGQDYYNQHK